MLYLIFKPTDVVNITHVINTDKFDVPEWARVQQLTWETMQVALSNVPAGLKVEIVAVSSCEDLTYLPEFISRKAFLNRNIEDIIPEYSGRNLPLLCDVLNPQLMGENTDYVIYTNIDIALMPFFYQMMYLTIDTGHEGSIVNRRRISSRFLDQSKPLHELYAQAGEIHSGYDCFIFKFNHLKQFKLGHVCVGIPHVGNTLAHNIFAFCENAALFTDYHITFHVGMQLKKDWGPKNLYKHNYREFRKILHILMKHFKIENFPGAYEPFFRRHFKWLMNPTVHYPTMLRLDLKSFKWIRKSPKKQFTERDLGYYEWLMKRINFD